MARYFTRKIRGGRRQKRTRGGRRNTRKKICTKIRKAQKAVRNHNPEKAISFVGEAIKICNKKMTKKKI